MAVVATALRGTSLDWPRTIAVVALAAMTVAAMALLPSPRARAWAKVKVAKREAFLAIGPKARAIFGAEERHAEAQPIRYVRAGLPPMLLLGEPGIGKTHFARRIAELLGTGFGFVPMSSLTAGWVLSGASSQWKNAKPGKVFDTFLNGEYANPVITVDEIDLAGEDAAWREIEGAGEHLDRGGPGDPHRLGEGVDVAVGFREHQVRVEKRLHARAPNLPANGEAVFARHR